MNGISSLIDLAAQGTIGVKSGFSETLDAQLAKIWQNTATALKRCALEKRRKGERGEGPCVEPDHPTGKRVGRRSIDPISPGNSIPDVLIFCNISSFEDGEGRKYGLAWSGLSSPTQPNPPFQGYVCRL